MCLLKGGCTLQPGAGNFSALRELALRVLDSLLVLDYLLPSVFAVNVDCLILPLTKIMLARYCGPVWAGC